MELIHIQRLQKIIDHLENGELGHVKFDFGSIHEGPAIGNYCGTLGCAMGELPIAFPSKWEFNNSPQGVSLLGKEDDGWDLEESVMDFFGLTEDEVDALFYPGLQYCVDGLDLLTDSASRYAVARNIRKFLQIKVCKILGDGSDTHRTI